MHWRDGSDIKASLTNKKIRLISTSLVVKSNPEPRLSLPPAAECWNYRPAPLLIVYVILGMTA